MSKTYYIWGPKYLNGELNGPDLIAGVTLYDNGSIKFVGRNPELMWEDTSPSNIIKMTPEEAEIFFHSIVAKEIPAGLQPVFKNAGYEESRRIIRDLELNDALDY